VPPETRGARAALSAGANASTQLRGLYGYITFTAAYVQNIAETRSGRGIYFVAPLPLWTLNKTSVTLFSTSKHASLQEDCISPLCRGGAHYLALWPQTRLALSVAAMQHYIRLPACYITALPSFSASAGILPSPTRLFGDAPPHRPHLRLSTGITPRTVLRAAPAHPPPASDAGFAPAAGANSCLAQRAGALAARAERHRLALPLAARLRQPPTTHAPAACLPPPTLCRCASWAGKPPCAHTLHLRRTSTARLPPLFLRLLHCAEKLRVQTLLRGMSCRTNAQRSGAPRACNGNPTPPAPRTSARLRWKKYRADARHLSIAAATRRGKRRGYGKAGVKLTLARLRVSLISCGHARAGLSEPMAGRKDRDHRTQRYPHGLALFSTFHAHDTALPAALTALPFSLVDMPLHLTPGSLPASPWFRLLLPPLPAFF